LDIWVTNGEVFVYTIPKSFKILLIILPYKKAVEEGMPAE
jgi:hypothetical protein